MDLMAAALHCMTLSIRERSITPTVPIAEQLIEERLKATKKQLPSFGPKDFCVTGSVEEKEKIHNVLSTTKSLLACERVEKSNFLSNAEWDSDLKLAKVTKKVGKFFETFGHAISGCDYLYPEECLFLLENVRGSSASQKVGSLLLNSIQLRKYEECIIIASLASFASTCWLSLDLSNLELFSCGLTVSIQRGYSLLLGFQTGCTLNEYRVYAHLSKSGYRVFRHDRRDISYNKECRSSSAPSIIARSDKEALHPSVITAQISAKPVESPSQIESNKFLLPATSDLLTEGSSTIGPASSRINVKNRSDEGEISTDSENQPNQHQSVQPNDQYITKSSRKHSWKRGNGYLNATTCEINAYLSRLNSLSQHDEILKALATNKSFTWKYSIQHCSRFYPPMNEILERFNTKIRPMRLSFAHESKVATTPLVGNCPRSPGLFRDAEFNAILELFPTLEQGEINALMPPSQLIPVKISSKFFSTTFNLENKRFICCLKPHQSPKRQFTPVLRNFVRPDRTCKKPKDQTKANARPFLNRYFSQGILPKGGKQKGKGPSKRELKRLKRSSGFKARQYNRNEKTNLTDRMQKIMNLADSSPASQNPSAQKFPSSLTSNQSSYGSSSGKNVGGSRLMDSTINNSGRQSHHRIQVKPEFQSTFNGSQVNKSPMDQPLMNQPLINQPPMPQPFMNQPQMNQPLLRGQVKPEFQSISSSSQMTEPSVDQPLMNQPLTNQPFINQPFMNQPLIGGQVPLNNPANPLDPGVLGQVIANVVSQLLPNQLNPNLSNQMNPNFANSMVPNFQNPVTPGFPHQISPNFSNPIHSSTFNQTSAPFPNSNNPNFFNQPFPHNRFQNYNSRFPSQRFSRPYNNYGNNNGEMSEVTRQARRMQGMARRMLAMAQDMFKNPEEFAANPEKINLYNYSNRFRHPNNQGHWRFPHQAQNQNINFRSNFRPRFDSSYNDTHPNFGQNSSTSNMSENSYSHNSFNPDNSCRQRNEEGNVGSFTTTNEIPETKFNPNAASSTSNSSPTGEGNDIFFVDVAGENPSNLLSQARTIPASKPTVSFKEKKPVLSSSSSESSSDDDDDDIEVIEPSKSKPVVETIDVLSSDEDTFMSISSKVNQSKFEADKICSKLGRSLKKKNSGERYNDVMPKRRRMTENNAEVITLDDDVVILDSEPIHSESTISKSPTNSSTQEKSNLVGAADPVACPTNEKVHNVKQESSDDIRVKTENESQPSVPRSSVDTFKVKEERETSDSSEEAALEATDVTIKTEIFERNEPEKENETEKIDPTVSKNTVDDCRSISSPSTGKEAELADESMDTSLVSEELDITRSSDSTENDLSSNKALPEKPSKTLNIIPSDSHIVGESHKEGWATLKAGETVAIDSHPVRKSSKGGWAHLKEVKNKETSINATHDSYLLETTSKETGTSQTSSIAPDAVESPQLPEVTEIDRNQNIDEESILPKPSQLENNTRQRNEEIEKLNISIGPEDKRKTQSLLQPHHCLNLGTVLNALQVFKSKVDDSRDLPQLKVSFDVYQPKKVFGKVSRPDPDFRIIVTSYTDPVPSPSQIDEITGRYSDNVKILFAVVHPSTIAFFFIGNVHVPVQIDDVLF